MSLPGLRLVDVAEALPDDLEPLRVEALAGGFGHLERLAADWASGAVRFDRNGEVLIAARLDSTLAGIGGLTIDPAVHGALRMRRF
jgi:hypothetical protein